jgi:hypothetical protein
MTPKEHINNKRQKYNAKHPDDDWDIAIYNAWKYQTREKDVCQSLCIIMALASLILVFMVW